MSQTISIQVPSLTRVEGEGALELEIHDQKITQLKFRIYEPPRLFEKLLQGRSYNDVVDIVARICGICPVAYQMSAVQAIEEAFETKTSEWVTRMRRLLYCGEWIESHSLHIHLLALPDYFGFQSATEMARDYPDPITRGMRLQRLGNEIITLLGKRSVHPVGVCVGGFYKAPKKSDVKQLHDKLSEGIEESKRLLQWIHQEIQFPQHHHEFTAVSVVDSAQYPMIGEHIGSSAGLEVPAEQFNEYFKEHQVPHSTALHCLLNGAPYLLGPLARINLNSHRLQPAAQAALMNSGIAWPSRNTFHGLMARAVEIYHCFIEARELLQHYESTEFPCAQVRPQAGVGYGSTEAPRGLLWHRYEMSADGTVRHATIIPPTSQNQAQIECELQHSLQVFGLDRSTDELRQYSEMIIRNYDPCISCSTHFLNLKVTRR